MNRETYRETTSLKLSTAFWRLGLVAVPLAALFRRNLVLVPSTYLLKGLFRLAAIRVQGSRRESVDRFLAQGLGSWSYFHRLGGCLVCPKRNC